MSFDNYDLSSNENFSKDARDSSSHTSWINLPRLSLIELAYKLKQTELKILKQNGEWNSLENSLKEEEEEEEESIQDNDVEETDDNEFYFGIEQTAKDALQAIKKTYIDDEENSNNVETHSNTFQTPLLEKINKKFVCGWCNYTTDSKSHLMRHSKALHKSKELKFILQPENKQGGRMLGELRKRHQCDMCQYKTNCRSHLKRHQASVHCKNKSYECPICNEEFARSEKAKEHHFKYHPERHFDIRNMHKISQQNASSVYEDSDQNRDKTAAIDSDMISMYLNQSDHSNAKNDDIPTSSLPTEHLPSSTFTFIKKSVLGDEVQSSEGDNLSPFSCNKSALIRCLKCNDMCKDLWQLRSHVGQAHPCSREHFCKVCPYSTNQQQRLLTHMLKHKEIFCGLCDFSTTNNSIFHLHTQTCNFKKAFTCSTCNITFTSFYTYKQHMTSLHNDNSTKQCPECMFTCQSTKELNQHIQLHQWKVCQVCPFLAPSQEALILHISEVHSVFEENSWVCSVCRHTEQSSEQLAHHFNTHVPDFFHCPIGECDFKCLLESSLELHSKYMHSRDSEALPLEADVTKVTGVNSKQSRKGDHSHYGSHKRLKVSTEVSTEALKQTDTASKMKQDSLPTLQHTTTSTSIPTTIATTTATTMPTFMFSEDDTIVVTPTSPGHKKEEAMFCPRCPDRAPFVYRRSFQKHLNQHAMEDQLNKC